jgi:hypothetical protein
MESAMAAARNVVLVHGGFVDGSGWEGVHEILRKDGFNVSIVQNPTTSLADDVDRASAPTKRRLMFACRQTRTTFARIHEICLPNQHPSNAYTHSPCMAR